MSPGSPRETKAAQESRRRAVWSRMPAFYRSPLAPVCAVVGGLLFFLAWTLLK